MLAVLSLLIICSAQFTPMLNLILVYYFLLTVTATSPLECPRSEPRSGSNCPTWADGTHCTYGKQTCCNGFEAPLVRAICNGGNWIVVVDDSCIFGCDFHCPPEQPEQGAQCTLHTDVSCSYNNVTCCDGSQRSSDWAWCAGGKWITASADFDMAACRNGCSDKQDSPPTLFVETSPMPKCPQDKPETGTYCDTVDVECTYGRQTCCNGAEESAFRATCVGGKWEVLINDPCVFGCERQCPVEKPIDGAACKVQKELDCRYDLLCCKGDKIENLYSARCVTGKWQVTAAYISTEKCLNGCTTTCPTDTPLIGTPCQVLKEVSCSYDLPCCNGDKIAKFHTAQCVAGKWAVASILIGTEQCRNGCTSICPAKTPLEGTSCQVLTSVSCSYDLPCCNGDKITNFYTARCVAGKWAVASTKISTEQCRNGCTSTCPAATPLEGALCQVLSSVSCSYDLPCCNGDKRTNFYTAQCVTGKWAVASIKISTEQCRNGCTSTCPPTLPSDKTLCQVLISVSCSYDLPCDNGGNVTNFHTARCVAGNWVVASQDQSVFDKCRNQSYTTCSATLPDEGTPCQLQHGITCQYDLPCCYGDSIKNYYVARCVVGKWGIATTKVGTEKCLEGCFSTDKPTFQKFQQIAEFTPEFWRKQAVAPVYFFRKPEERDIGCPSKAPEANTYCNSEDTTCSYNPYCCCGDSTKCTNTLSATCEKGAWKVRMAAVDCAPCVSKYPPEPKDH